MDSFSVRGVIRGGQVVLDSPLDLPDGTPVTVTDCEPTEDTGINPDDLRSREALNQLLIDIRNRRQERDAREGQTNSGVSRG